MSSEILWSVVFLLSYPFLLLVDFGTILFWFFFGRVKKRRGPHKKIWICGDVLMDILPFFDRSQLGLKIALLSPRFDALVDTHFNGKTTELTIWRRITIRKDEGPEPRLFVWIDDNYVAFPLPDHSLPTKIRFKHLQIEYIDHSVIEFVRSNKQIWDSSGTKLELSIANGQQILDVLAREMLPIFATNIRHLTFDDGDDLGNLRRRISPTLLTDFDQLISIDSCDLCPDGIADNGPNATAGQALTKWLHIPTKNGQPKRLFCEDFDEEGSIEWVNSFKEAFSRATNSSVSYKILFAVHKTSIGPFKLVNERTKEKLTLEKVPRYNFVYWLLKRCPISEKAATDQWENDENWDDNLNSIRFEFSGDINESIGPLSPPAAEEEKEKADE